MPMEKVKELLEKIKTDEALQKEISAILSKKDPAAVDTFLRDHGVPEDEIGMLLQQQQSFSASGQMSDEMLEMVAGGKCWSKAGDFCIFAHNDQDGGCVLAHRIV